MTALPDLHIQHGLPDVFRPAAAALFYEAFGLKLKPIIGSKSTGIPIIQASIDPACCIAAKTDTELLGVAGYTHNHRQFVYVRLATLAGQFGYLSGIVRYAMFALANRRPRPGELLMDGIVVHPAMRGKGVGTQLLSAIYQFARTHRYQAIRLDVVDTNPNARRLYERTGFVPLATHTYPFLRSLGFSSVTTMLWPVK